MALKTKELGDFIRKVRKSQGATQRDLALTAGVGLRFISDLENGKETCEIAKVLMVLQTLGITVRLETS